MRTMFELLLDAAAVLTIAYASFALARATCRRGRWPWVALLGALAALNWLVSGWLDRTVIVPVVAALLFLLSLTGLAPDDSVLGPTVSAQSRWFRRGLSAAVLGTVVGAATWGIGLL